MDSLAGNQDIKAFAHACWRDQMFELQRDFGAFLGQAAFFEGIGKLVGFADAHQELGLRDQLVCPHPVFFRGGGECREVYVGGYVLFARSFVGIGAY